MKKRLLTLSFALFAALAAKAQQSEMAQAVVHYKFSHLRDTTQKDKPYTENMILFLGQTSSVYKSYDRKLQDAMMRKQMEQQLADQRGSGNVNIKMTGSRPTTRAEYFQFPSQNKFIRKETLITPYLIEEPMPAINWKISTDTASFGSLHCQKATAHFKGRDYTAWFCPDVPFHAGPWKLNGLPGLIVEAYDTNKEVDFKFDGMETVTKSDKPAVAAPTPPAGGLGPERVVRFGGDDPNVDPNLIALPADAVKTTEKEFKNLQDAMRKDPQAFMAAMGGGANMRMAPPGATVAGGNGGGAPPVRTMTVMAAPGGSSATINNPLELPEKK